MPVRGRVLKPADVLKRGCDSPAGAGMRENDKLSDGRADAGNGS